MKVERTNNIDHSEPEIYELVAMGEDVIKPPEVRKYYKFDH